MMKYSIEIPIKTASRDSFSISSNNRRFFLAHNIRIKLDIVTTTGDIGGPKHILDDSVITNAINTWISFKLTI